MENYEYNVNYAGGNPEQNPNHNYYQNLYNMFGGYNPVVDKQYGSLRRLGAVSGIILLACIFMQTLIGAVIGMTSLSSLYFNSDRFYFHAIGAIAQFFYTFLPFFLLYLFSKPVERRQMNVFNLPKSKELYLLAIFAGFMFCMIGNSATTALSVIFSIFGITFNSGMEDMATPSGFIGILMYIINVAVVPALFEEFAFRAVLLQPLRKYGDWFAIIATSFAFAVLHGNMVQIPFAFIVGIALGYFCIKTQSIWTSVTIHFMNNLFSVIFSLYIAKNPDASMFPYYVVTSAFVFVGAIAMVLFKMNCHKKLKKDATVLSKSKELKKAAYVCSPAMIIALFNAIYSSLSLATIYSPLGAVALLVAAAVVMYFLIKWILHAKRDTRIKAGASSTVSMILTVVSGIITLLSIFGISG